MAPSTMQVGMQTIDRVNVAMVKVAWCSGLHVSSALLLLSMPAGEC